MKRLIKTSKIVSICLVFSIILMYINSFAAVVSDNDGSAFITKAEFDSLKNNFQSQIDQYNTSIDSKIDSAIASYLAGIKTETTRTINTVLTSWDDVTLRNYELANQYGIPSGSLEFSFYGAGHGTTSWNQFPSAYGLACTASGVGTVSKLKAVLLKSGSESDFNDLTRNEFYWSGYINDYLENISMAKLGKRSYLDISSSYRNITLGIYDTVKLSNISNGYYNDSTLKDFWSTKWLPLIQASWETNIDPSVHTRGTVNWSPEFVGGFFKWSKKYQESNKTNEHELTWSAINENVINPNFNNSFYQFSDNTRNSKNMLDLLTVSVAGTWLKMQANAIIPANHDGTRTINNYDDASEGAGKGWVKGAIESHYNSTDLSAQVYDWTRGATSGGQYKIPTIGGLGPISSDKIYLQKDNLKYVFDNSEYKKNITTMNDGFPLLYATKDSKLTWECVFSDIEGSSAVTTNGEVKVILSYGEFGDASASAGGYVQSDGKKGTTEYVFTTSSKKCKITWTMQEDGWIYAKWFPAALTSSSAASAANWSVTLDNKNSNKVTYVSEN